MRTVSIQTQEDPNNHICSTSVTCVGVLLAKLMPIRCSSCRRIGLHHLVNRYAAWCVAQYQNLKGSPAWTKHGDARRFCTPEAFLCLLVYFRGWVSVVVTRSWLRYSTTQTLPNLTTCSPIAKQFTVAIAASTCLPLPLQSCQAASNARPFAQVYPQRALAWSGI